MVRTEIERKRVSHGVSHGVPRGVRHSVSHLPFKPNFILRARLTNLLKKNQKGKNEWWKTPIPHFCYDPIIEITDCKDKKLEKR